jgi:hypothetical protein
LGQRSGLQASGIRRQENRDPNLFFRLPLKRPRETLAILAVPLFLTPEADCETSPKPFRYKDTPNGAGKFSAEGHGKTAGDAVRYGEQPAVTAAGHGFQPLPQADT